MLWLELLICFIAFLWIWHWQKRSKLPPGPFSIPLLGTVDIFKKSFKTIFDEKYFQYKEFCTFHLGPTSTLVLVNDFKIVKDLFNRDEFCGRPKTWWHQNVRGYRGRNLGIISTDGPTWTEQRRFSLKQLRYLILHSVETQEIYSHLKNIS